MSETKDNHGRDQNAQGAIRWMCAGCMGFEPPEGSDPRTLDPTEWCNPSFCDLARWREKSGTHEETKQEPEAWEVIAGEWPPLVRGNKPHSPLEAWGWWEEAAGITRRAYAESIAPRLVRGAARKKFGVCDVTFFCFGPDGRFDISISQFGPGYERVRVRGGDICTAALAAIRALEGGARP